MIKSAQEYSIHSLFDPEAKITYNVPKYQREYSWKESNWEDLFSDLEDEGQEHFLGTILVVNQGNDSLKIAPLEIIDGQQRLLTISIIYAASYERMSHLPQETSNDEDFITEKQNLKYKLIEKHQDNQLKFSPQEQSNNRADYGYLIESVGAFSNNTAKPKNYGNRKISRAYSYFKEKISEYSYKELKKFLGKLNDASVVKIEVSSYSDAYVLFQSLNNRGTPLLATDLIKTNMLSEMEKNNIMSLDESYKKWQQIINNLIDDPVVNERFLRQYYNAFKTNQKFVTVAKKFPRATRTNLIKVYNDNLIPKYPDFLFKELLDKSEIYGDIVKGCYPESERISNNLMDLTHVRGVPAYAFLLYLLSEFHDTALIEEVTEYIVKWYARRNLTDFPATRNADTIFIKLIESCRIKKKEGITSKFILNELKGNMSSIDVVKNKINGDIYRDNPDISRFLLSKIEECHMSKERKVNLWEKTQNGLVFTIEHIFPEGENIPREWINMIANGDENLAKKNQEQYVHKVGNLTLTAYNSNLSNLSFKKKRDRTDKQGIPIGYKNGFYLNHDLKDKDIWNVDEIKMRGGKLISEFIDFLELEGD